MAKKTRIPEKYLAWIDALKKHHPVVGGGVVEPWV
jgi:hypothetical protein